MDPNQNNELAPSWSDIDDEEDIQFMVAAYEYQQHLEQEAAHPQVPRTHIYRERELAEERLQNDYFVQGCKYTHGKFRRRFRMSRKLFLQIISGIESYESDVIPDHFQNFKAGQDCTGRGSISALMKCNSGIRQLAYGTAPDAFDEYLQMGETTSRLCLDNFNMCVMDLFMHEFLRTPIWSDIQRIYELHEREHGFPGMLGSIDCMRWAWKNCPVAWQGQFGRGDKRYLTIILKAIASQDLLIWHAFFGMAGANNDINVLDNSNLFDKILANESPRAPYMVNGRRYEHGYYLADRIYPQWSTFVKSFSATTDEKHSYFKRKQEDARKDIERAFGVLQGCWGILQQPARAWEIVKIQRIMYTCIILHIMILKDQKFILREYRRMWVDPAPCLRQERWIAKCDTQRRKTREMRDAGMHTQLQRDLMEHVWQKRLQRQQQHEEEYSEDDE